VTDPAEWLVSQSRAEIDQAAAEVRALAEHRGVALEPSTIAFLADQLSSTVNLSRRHAGVDDDNEAVVDDRVVDFCTWIAVVWATLAGDDELARRIAARAVE
jgi:hypothetical protein